MQVNILNIYMNCRVRYEDLMFNHISVHRGFLLSAFIHVIDFV